MICYARELSEKPKRKLESFRRFLFGNWNNGNCFWVTLEEILNDRIFICAMAVV